ncbi:MAG: tetratricopeptide repeat protein [Candidatus Adiutrix sp.]|jgi:hypothetical protein|nr:tetratricopeptide repeat protein [Candidatus Adiutrix sp.]
MISDAQFRRLLDLGLAGVHLGRPAQARALLEGLLAYKPGHAPTLLGLALTHTAVNEFAPAEAILRNEVLAKNPDDPEALAILGLTLALAGRTAEASAALERIPGDSPAKGLARAFESAGD